MRCAEMKRMHEHTLKLSVLIVYVIIFYCVWTLWEFFGKPFISSTVEHEYLSQFLKSGVVKNLVWTLPAILLVNHFRNDVYVGLREMFSVKAASLKYLLICFLFTVYLFAGALLQRGYISISENFRISDLIIVLFVGLTEEMVFRGWLLNATVREQKKWAPIIINSVMFLLIHFPIWICEGHFVENFQNFSFLCIMVLSVIFSWTFLKSRTIWVPIFLHMYWDLLMFLLFI